MQLDLDVQNASGSTGVPADDELARWAGAALAGRLERAELTIRLVDEAEGAELNQRYRGRSGSTNILSFPFDAPSGMADCDLIGDLVICVPVAAREARAQGKKRSAHWAHLVVHGVLHLIGYDHLTEGEAADMEALETAVLGGLGFPPPYEDE